MIPFDQLAVFVFASLIYFKGKLCWSQINATAALLLWHGCVIGVPLKHKTFFKSPCHSDELTLWSIYCYMSCLWEHYCWIYILVYKQPKALLDTRKSLKQITPCAAKLQKHCIPNVFNIHQSCTFVSVRTSCTVLTNSDLICLTN